VCKYRCVSTYNIPTNKHTCTHICIHTSTADTAHVFPQRTIRELHATNTHTYIHSQRMQRGQFLYRNLRAHIQHNYRTSFIQGPFEWEWYTLSQADIAFSASKSTMIANTAQRGGAVYVGTVQYGARELIFDDLHAEGNVATDSGGAVMVDSCLADISVLSSNIWNNAAEVL
jgi:hypothetical protein